MSSHSPARLLAPGALIATVAAVVLAVSTAGPGQATGVSSVVATSAAATTRTPAKSGRRTYTVRAGDSLSSVAARYDLTVQRLQELNPDADAAGLLVGARLRLR